MSHTVMQTVMLTATTHVRRLWLAGGVLHVVGCWHPVHGAFEISVSATSKGGAVVVAADLLKGTGAIAGFADISRAC